MKQYQVQETGRVDAPPAVVYGVIADYRQHHPQVVPPEYFAGLDVLEGGVGSGTRTRVTMHLLGLKRVFEQVITEPEPGRVLMEENTDGSAVTTFTVEVTGTGASDVTIATKFPRQPGISGLLDYLIVTVLFRRIYRKELAQLAAYVSGLPTGARGTVVYR